MKRHTQKAGVRRWAGDDLIELQSEALRAIDSIFEPYPPCVISGCLITANGSKHNVSKGIVALKGKNEANADVTMVVPFLGAENVTLPIYLTLGHTIDNRIYGDGILRPVSYNYTANSTSIAPTEPHLVISVTGTTQFGNLTQKEALEELKTKVDKITGKGLSTSDFTPAEKSKLDTIANNANNYVHPNDASTRHVTDAEKVTWNNKVDKITGKGLSTNDYTSAEKNKLASIASNANNYVHPDDASNRHVTDAEKVTWNNKVDKITGKGLSTNDYTSAEKSKLASIANNANNYVHPDDASNRHVTDAEKVTWNNKVDKIAGKGLSTNDYTNAEKNKLASRADRVVNTRISNYAELIADLKWGLFLGNTIRDVYQVTHSGKTPTEPDKGSSLGQFNVDFFNVELGCLIDKKGIMRSHGDGWAVRVNNQFALGVGAINDDCRGCEFKVVVKFIKK